MLIVILTRKMEKHDELWRTRTSQMFDDLARHNAARARARLEFLRKREFERWELTKLGFQTVLNGISERLGLPKPGVQVVGERIAVGGLILTRTVIERRTREA